MKKRLLACLTALCLLFTPGLHGHAREAEAGTYSLRFYSETQGRDINCDFVYSDGFFTAPASTYNPALAEMSLGLAMSGFSSLSADGDAGRQGNLAAAYAALGFSEARYFHYDAPLTDASDKVAFSLACKTVERDGERFSLIPVVIRGSGYGAEWAGNFHVGKGSRHQGFDIAAQEVYLTVQAYLKGLEERGLLEQSVKFWVVGFSRGGAVANLTAVRLDDDSRFLKRNVFAYTFAAPNTLRASGRTAWSARENYANIINIVGSCDIVPCLPLERWDYLRYGQSLYLPGTRLPGELSALRECYGEITGADCDFSGVTTLARVETLRIAAGKLAQSVDAYVEEGYQSLLMDCLADFFGQSGGSTAGSAASMFSLVLRHLRDREAAMSLLLALGSVSPDDGAELAQNHYPEVYLALLRCLGQQLGDTRTVRLAAMDDVSEQSWAYDAVEYVRACELMDGTSETGFSPNAPMSRAMLATVLYRMAGSPRTFGRGGFSDVPAGQWYTNAVAWASGEGIVTGYPEGDFRPDEAVTREQLATILYRYLHTMDYDTSAGADLSGYADGGDVHEYARAAMQWSCAAELIRGTDGGRLDPQGRATRAQVATMLMRLYASVL